MANYAISSWVDLARELLPQEKAERMRTFLATSAGAPSRRLVASLERLAAAAENERQERPPDYAVRSVNALFQLQQPGRRTGRTMIGLALTFDSALAPAPAGARTAQGTTRQLLFQSDDYALDLRVGYSSASGGAIVVGQFLRRQGEPMRRVPAYLVSEGKISSAAFTNEFGSFYIEGDSQGPGQLRLLTGDDEEISIELGPQTAPANAG